MYEEADTVSVTSTHAMRTSKRDATRKVRVGTDPKFVRRPLPNTPIRRFPHGADGFHLSTTTFLTYVQAKSSGGVDEERFLTLQMENRTLKTEAVERDRKLKQTLARLARAEEAAKRASLAPGSARPTKGDSNSSRLFAAEQRVSELEDETRELTRKLQKESERGAHFKNMCKEYKVKLDGALKAARMIKPEQRSTASVFPGHSSSLEERMKDMLRQERSRAAALAQECDELRKAVRAAGNKVPPAAPAATVSTDGDEWVLEDLVHEGQTYLLDRPMMKVYDKPSSDAGWPEPVGRLVDGRVHLVKHEDLFNALDSYLKREQIHLKEAFDRFDSDQNEHLDSDELGKFLEAVMPGVTVAQQRYFCAMCDTNNDGKVTYMELVESMKNCINIGAEVADRKSAEVLEVIKRLKDRIDAAKSTVSAVFHRFDKDNSGVLENRELLSMFEELVPDITLKEKRFLLALVAKLDLNGDGHISMAELFKTLRAVKPTIAAPVAAKSAKQVASRATPAVKAAEAIKAFPPEPETEPSSAILPAKSAADSAPLQKRSRQPAALAGEVASLRKQLSEATARSAELERKLKKEQQTALPAPGTAGYVAPYSASELQAEIKSAWERAGVLQKRYHEAQSALGTMKANHTRVLQQLDDTHKRLNEERRENLKLAAEEKRLAMELEAAREFEPSLEQSRRERAALEKENHQLLATAMNAPSESQSETRKLRTLMAEAQRERADAELREVELRRTIQTIGTQGVEEAAATREERDRLRVECSRMEVELEAANEKISVLMDMSRAALENREMNNAQVAVVDDEIDEGSLRAELRGLRETFGDQVEELRKAHRLLKLEEQQVDDLRAALVEEKTRADKMNENLFKKVKAHENELDRRQKKIHALEAQVRGREYVEATDKPTSQALRSSQDGMAQDVTSKPPVDDMADLSPGENIFELRLMSVDVDADKIGEKNPETFMTVDFFEHETQTTPVQQDLSVSTEHTLQFIVKADDFFLGYLDTKRLPVELHKSLGMDFSTIGVANINLSWVLDDTLAGRTAEAPAEHFCDVIGRSGEVIARLRYAAYMRKSIVADVRKYRRNKPPVRVKPSKDAYVTAYTSAAETPFPNMISVELSCCRDLVPRVGPASSMVPYCSYQFPGLPSHDTVYGRGANPDFDDVHDMPLKRTKDVEAKMVKSAMEIIAFDDADTDLEGAGVIGIARVDLEPLSKGIPVTGSFPLFSQSRERRGTVFVSIAWKDPNAPTATSVRVPAPASSAARVSELRSEPSRMSQELKEDTVLGSSAAPQPSTSVSLKPGDSAEASASAGSAEGSADSIVVSIGQFELGKTLYHDHKVRQMFMLFEFMPKFHRDDEQQTMRVKKESQFVDFGYKKAFPVKDSGLRAALAALLDGGNPEDATIPFCLVSDDNGIDFEDVGFFELKLTDIYKHGDYVDRRVEVLDRNDVPIGRVAVSVVAQKALQSVALTR